MMRSGNNIQAVRPTRWQSILLLLFWSGGLLACPFNVSYDKPGQIGLSLIVENDVCSRIQALVISCYNDDENSWEESVRFDIKADSPAAQSCEDLLPYLEAEAKSFRAGRNKYLTVEAIGAGYAQNNVIPLDNTVPAEQYLARKESKIGYGRTKVFDLRSGSKYEFDQPICIRGIIHNLGQYSLPITTLSENALLITGFADPEYFIAATNNDQDIRAEQESNLYPDPKTCQDFINYSLNLQLDSGYNFIEMNTADFPVRPASYTYRTYLVVYYDASNLNVQNSEHTTRQRIPRVPPDKLTSTLRLQIPLVE
jgi:hypothetical protein